jgi:hypothetical protein
MYIQLTTRCNMSCAHCCFSCSNEGDDLSLDDFNDALHLARCRKGTVTLGGGEPTIHPLFEEFLVKAVAALPGRVGIVTNGKYRHGVTALLRYAAAKQVFARLSVDQYHEPIDADIRREFEGLPYMPEWMDTHIGYSYVAADRVTPMGRGIAVSRMPSVFVQCICPGPFITPDGRVNQCACGEHSLGHVADWRRLSDVYATDQHAWPCSRVQRMQPVQTGAAACAN